MNFRFENNISEIIFSRNFYQKFLITLFIPFYIFLLFAIHKGWVYLTNDFLPRYFILFGVPTFLFFLYFTSHKKIFPQRIGDCIQILIWILVVTAANTYFGGPMMVDGPLFFAVLLVMPFFSLLLDPFLLYFIASLINSVLIVEFLVATLSFSVILMVELVFKIATVLIISFICIVLINKISIEKKNRREIKLAYEKLKNFSKKKSDFLKFINHELGSPLTVIKIISSMLKEGSIKEEKKEKFVAKIHLASGRLIDILSDILKAQGLIPAGPVKFIPSRIEKILKNQIENLEPLAKAKKVKIVFAEPKQSLPEININPVMASEAFSHIIENAILYSSSLTSNSTSDPRPSSGRRSNRDSSRLDVKYKSGYNLAYRLASKNPLHSSLDQNYSLDPKDLPEINRTIPLKGLLKESFQEEPEAEREWTVDVSIDLNKEKDKEFIQIFVKDFGIGLDEEDKNNIFKIFYRGKEASILNPKGCGFGNFIIKTFIDYQGGTIKAKSEGRNKGTEFIINLPVNKQV